MLKLEDKLFWLALNGLKGGFDKDKNKLQLPDAPLTPWAKGWLEVRGAKEENM